MTRQKYLCPNCRAPVTFGMKFCCNCGVRFQWLTPQEGKQLTTVSCGTPPSSVQDPTVMRLPRQEVQAEEHNKPGWDKPQSYSHKPSIGKQSQPFQNIVPIDNSVGLQDKDLASGRDTAPVKTVIIKLLEHFLDKQASFN